MFESVQTETEAARFRAAAFPPTAAVVFILVCAALFPVLTLVPAWLYRSMVAACLAGTIGGVITIVRALRRGRPHGIAIGWLVAAILVELICARLLLWFTVPWL